MVSNPQYSFFKAVYRRHTNFSIESVQQSLNQNAKIESTNLVSKLTNAGDLVHHIWLDVSLFNEGFSLNDTGEHYAAWTNSTGYALIKEYELLIGGKSIDIHYPQWLDIYNELTDHKNSECIGVNKHASKELYLLTSTSLPNLRLHVPLKFWFCRKASLSLPLIALQYHDVEVRILTRNINTLINTNADTTGATPVTKPPEVNLWVDFIYLDDDERKRFAENTHEYLIEQVQQIEIDSVQSLERINLNFPVKELIWIFQNNTVKQEKEFKDGVTNIDAMSNKSTSLNNANDYFCHQTTTSVLLNKWLNMLFQRPYYGGSCRA